MKFLRLLLPVLSSSFNPSSEEKVLTKVFHNHDFYLPFHQYGLSLTKAQQEIYADINRLTNKDGVGLFNILAFWGVFFGSPFANSGHYQWFKSLANWERFQDKGKGKGNKHTGEEYYVKKNCYGQSQIGHDLSLLSSYWDQRLL